MPAPGLSGEPKCHTRAGGVRPEVIRVGKTIRHSISTAPPKRSFARVCVLVGRMEYQPCAGAACTSRIHGHVTEAMAERLVAQEQAEWMMVSWTTARGHEKRRREPAIRLKKRRSWKARPSGEDRAKMKVMQLVD